MVSAQANRSNASGDELVDLIAEGRHRAAACGCARVYGRLLGQLCFSLLGSQQEAEEALQETLLGAYRGMAGFRGEGSLKSWLYGIARRQCARRLERRRGDRAAQLQLVSQQAAPQSSDGLPEETLRDRRRVASVQRALAGIKPTEREAVLLRYQAQLSYRELGEAIGVEEATARKRVSRALESLRRLLRPEEIE